MRKLILAAVVAIITVVNTNAQASFGAKGGVSFASIMGNTNSSVKFRTAYSFGFVTEIETSSSTSVQPEILYSSQGFKWGGGYVGGIGEEYYRESDNIKLDYLNIPIVFKYYINDEFSFEVGPQVGFLLSSSTESGNADIERALDNNLTNASFDFLVGFGYKFDNGFNVNARYIGGLTNIWKGYVQSPPPGYWYYDYGKRNSVFQLSIGYYFN